MKANSKYPKSVSKFIREEKSRIRKKTDDLEKQKTLIAEMLQQFGNYKKQAVPEKK